MNNWPADNYRPCPCSKVGMEAERGTCCGDDCEGCCGKKMKHFMKTVADALEIICCWQHMLPDWLDGYLQGVWILLFGQHCIFFALGLRLAEKYDFWNVENKDELYPNYPVNEDVRDTSYRYVR